VDVPSLSFDEIADNRPSGESSEEIRASVQAARELQRGRYDGVAHCNAHLDSKKTREYCALGDGARKLLETALEQLGLSARAYDKVLRIARTIADIAGEDAITEQHIAEAIQYRSMDRAAI
jgi:magnesium chelatase family protein